MSLPETQTEKSVSVRQAVYGLLKPFEKPSATIIKADERLSGWLNSNDKRSATDKGFATALFYSTLRHWFLCGYWIKTLTNKKLKDHHPDTRLALRLGMAQILALDTVPDFAAVSETVTMVKSLRFPKKTVGMVNAVLRRFAQMPTEERWLNKDNDDTALIEASMPVWFWQWMNVQYDSVQVLNALRPLLSPEPLTIRVNTLATTPESYHAVLIQQGTHVEQPDSFLPDLPEMFVLPKATGNPQNLPGFKRGLVYVQNVQSARTVTFLAPQKNERVLDLCAAPGSKTTRMASLMNNTGEIVAVEPEEARLQRLVENVARLGVTNVTTRQATAEAVSADVEESALAPFDKVLVDAPCSALGVIRRHPDRLVQMREADLKHYPAVQESILKAGLKCLKAGGILVYSTCTLNPEENTTLVARVLAQMNNAYGSQFKLVDEAQTLMNAQDHSHGFYMAKIESA